MASKIASGEVIACPAEGVWGLSCDPFSEQAVLTLLAMKRRAVDKGLIVVAADAAAFSEVLLPLPERVQKAIALSWPGPNTWLVPHRDVFPDWVTGDSEDVAIRVTSAPALGALCHALGGAVVSTSANPAGLAPPQLGDSPETDLVLNGAASELIADAAFEAAALIAWRIVRCKSDIPPDDPPPWG